MELKRVYEDMEQWLVPGKALIILGARRVGKTTLLRRYAATLQRPYRWDTGDDIAVQELLGSQDLQRIREYIGRNTVYFLDEAQRVPNVGWALKLIVDNIPGVQVIATGSSSFELMGQMGEPLTGRKRTLPLYAIAQHELVHQNGQNISDIRRALDERLIFGSYPEVVVAATHDERREILTELVNSYLLKDVLELDRIRSSKTLLNLLELVALQVGSEVSHRELATTLAVDTKTVGRYLDLLEKSYVLYNLRGLSRNLREEVTRTSKYYFFDTGIRNAVINNFNVLSKRADVGALWENFLVMERLKKRTYAGPQARDFFWRTWQQQEIDLVEERDGGLHAYECKWQATPARVPRQWVAAYPDASFEVVHRDNYLSFVS